MNYSDDTPSDVIDESKEIENDLLPNKSEKKYNQVYKNFKDWQLTKQTTSASEEMILVYLKKLKTEKNYAPPTMWSNYSMLKKTLLSKKNVDISTYKKLTSYLKKNSVGYTSTQAKNFSAKQLEKFLTEAPDDKYLAAKVRMI